MADVELQLPPDVAYVGLARLLVTVAARQAGMLDVRVEDLKIAVSEATTNAINAHRRGDQPQPVVLSFGRSGADHFVVRVADAGPGFEPQMGNGQAGREWSLENGLGITLIRGLADDVAFERDHGMVVRMQFAVDDG
ncbi:MAG: ATP-binding protein [Egibacteraceae bacterium]